MVFDRKAYAVKYYIANKAKLIAQQKKYCEENREKVRVAMVVYCSKHKESKREYDAKRYKENPDVMKERGKKWCKENPEKANARQARWVKNNPDAVLAKTRRYADTHPGANTASAAEYRKKNPTKVLEATKKWRGAHPENVKAMSVRDRHRRSALSAKTESSLTASQWNKILKNQGGVCAICKRPFDEHLTAARDHIVPLSKGGGLTFENVQALCKHCNSRKQANLDYSNIVTWLHVGDPNTHE